MPELEKELFQVEQVLKYIVYDHEKKDFCAYLPNKNVIITDINKQHKTINKLPLGMGDQSSDKVYIGDVEFFCELLFRNEDEKVLLSIEYYDDPNDKKIGKIEKEKIIKYVEGMILGFTRYITDYEEKPEEFFSSNMKVEDSWNDDWDF